MKRLKESTKLDILQEEVAGFLDRVNSINEKNKLNKGMEFELTTRLEQLKEEFGKRIIHKRPTSCMFQEAHDGIEKVHNRLRDKLNLEITSQIDRASFRARFNERLIVCCYGRTGTGKSSLGNLVGERISAIFHERSSGQQKHIERFKVDEVPVPGVRWFERDGLIWIDAPGTFGPDQKDDDDAIAARGWADVILFLEPAGQPFVDMTSQDLKHFQDSLINHDAFVIGLSRADDPRYLSITEHKYVPIPEGEKQGVLNWVRTQLPANRQRDPVVLFFSTYLANQAASAEELHSSGIADLLNAIADLLDRNSSTIKAERLNEASKQMNDNIEVLLSLYIKDINNIVSEAEESRNRALGELNSLETKLFNRLNSVATKAKEHITQGQSADPSREKRNYLEYFRDEGFKQVLAIVNEFASKHTSDFMGTCNSIRVRISALDIDVISLKEMKQGNGKKAPKITVARILDTLTGNMKHECESIARDAVEYITGEIEDFWTKLHSAEVDYKEEALRIGKLLGIEIEVRTKSPKLNRPKPRKNSLAELHKKIISGEMQVQDLDGRTVSVVKECTKSTDDDHDLGSVIISDSWNDTWKIKVKYKKDEGKYLKVKPKKDKKQEKFRAGPEVHRSDPDEYKNLSSIEWDLFAFLANQQDDWEGCPDAKLREACQGILDRLVKES